MEEGRPCSDLRDGPVRKRAVMEKERTLLSCIRAAIILPASGTTLLKVPGADPGVRMTGSIPIPPSMVAGVTGYVHFEWIGRVLRVLPGAES